MTDEQKTDDEMAEEAVVEIDDIEVEIDDIEQETAAPVAESGRDRAKLIAFVALPAAVVLAGGVAGFLKWESSSGREAQVAAAESVAAARDTATVILSYRPDSVEKDLNGARDRLTGTFLDSYTKLINDVVIPGAKQKKITAVAQVPAAASMSATPSHAEVLVFINQAVTIGNDAPTNTASSVRVTMDKVGGHWLVSGFDPV